MLQSILRNIRNGNEIDRRIIVITGALLLLMIAIPIGHLIFPFVTFFQRFIVGINTITSVYVLFSLFKYELFRIDA
jgi:hypothetical protein